MKLVVPDHRDVLCGRGTECQKHDGNQYLKSLIDRHLPKYAQAENKSDKSLILRDIIRSIIMRGGRFLKKDCSLECYFVAGIKSARDKVGHCLREAMTINKPQPSWRLNQMKHISSTSEIAKHNETSIEFEISSFQALAQVISRQQFYKDKDSEPNSMQICEDDQSFSFSVDLYSLDEITEKNAKELVAQELLLSSQLSPTHNGKPQGITQVDALYELPFEGEWEELILPRSNCQGFYFNT